MNTFYYFILNTGSFRLLFFRLRNKHILSNVNIQNKLFFFLFNNFVIFCFFFLINYNSFGRSACRCSSNGCRARCHHPLLPVAAVGARNLTALPEPFRGKEGGGNWTILLQIPLLEYFLGIPVKSWCIIINNKASITLSNFTRCVSAIKVARVRACSDLSNYIEWLNYK
jgi:hypothetical protein